MTARERAEKFNTLKGMNYIMRAMNNEDVYDAWTHTFPHEADDIDIMETVEDEELFAECVNEFFRLVIRGGGSGLYFNRKVYGTSGHLDGIEGYLFEELQNMENGID